jgi:Cu/Ag efflux protein CusF
MRRLVPRSLLIAAFACATLLVASGVAAQTARKKVEIEGSITALSNDSITVANSRRTLTCAVPSTSLIAGFAVGDRVEARCERRDDRRVLVRLKHEDNEVDVAVEVEGPIAALSLSSIAVGRGTAIVTCAIRPQRTLSGFSVGDRVEMKCQADGGQFVLRKLKHKHEHHDDD